MPNSILSRFLRLPLSIRVLTISLTIIILFGFFITFIEPETFPTIFEGIWWAIITTSTVGYGDYAPITVLGRITGMLLILTGVGFLSTYLVTLATAAVAKQNAYLEGKTTYKGQNHLIIIGWNERSKLIIHSIIKDQENIPITLVDESLTTNPVPETIHFVRGNSNLDSVLLKANIMTASKVIITADQNKEELQADMHSILSLLAIKGLNAKIPCIVEILTAEQIQNAKRAGADEIIETNSLTSFVMHNSLTSQDTMIAFLELLNQLKDKKLQFIPLTNIHGELGDYLILNNYLLADGKLLLGVKRGGTSYLNPNPAFQFEENDELIIIT
ncbi:potassium channel protein [Cytobacillus oceanisediminis]|uniref:Potassium channel protein n=2 Tax=Niallia TaxID=2837506 RepID=A0A941GFL0_NIACI|nr:MULTISPECIES: potassium channel family protein [Niallia]MBZ9534002.1 potassium channel protein [Cytobacillus oceanisediminis]MDU1846096.1 potassium channel family protein [Niallia nealsonii]MCB5235954.1 potassium channel family protein [Niallia circulans]MED3794181.1 potassium channel family protein [Niallia alba]NMO78925.1 potassium channel protein [Niallia alba]